MGKTATRLSDKQLLVINSTKLSPLDNLILHFLDDTKMATSEHVRRLFFQYAKSKTAGTRASNRALKRLKEIGLADTYNRRINPIRTGSKAYIWHLTEAGNRLLSLDKKYEKERKRYLEPAYSSASHTLSITDLYVQVVEICNNPGIDLVIAEFEPECWRTYHDNKSLRPDLFIKTKNGKYMYYWFFEVDLGTEDGLTIMEKCHRYIDYYKTGKEQAEHDAFPLVVWVVGTTSRKEQIKQKVKDIYKVEPNTPPLFTVITPNELYALLQNV